MVLHCLTRQQVRRVDQRAMEEYGLSGVVLMETAGRGVAGGLCQRGMGGPGRIADRTYVTWISATGAGRAGPQRPRQTQ